MLPPTPHPPPLLMHTEGPFCPPPHSYPDHHPHRGRCIQQVLLLHVARQLGELSGILPAPVHRHAAMHAAATGRGAGVAGQQVQEGRLACTTATCT